MTIDEQIQAIHAAADSNVPKIKKAFLAAIAELQSSVDITQLELAFLSGNVDDILAVMDIDRLNNLLVGIGMNTNAVLFNKVLQDVFTVGATVALTNLPDVLQKALSFNSLNERAVNAMRVDGASAITDLTASTKLAVRNALVRLLEDGTQPSKQSAAIRQLIGLTDSQMQAVLNFRQQLLTRQTMGFTPVNERRLSAVEQAVANRHMREGHLSNQQIDDMVDRYYQSLLNKRALDIARTESMNAVNNGQLELWKQGLDIGIFNDAVDRKFWIVTPDDRLRDTHRAIPSMNPYGVKITSQFVTPFGMVNGPGDRNVNLINCRCVLILGEYGQTFQY